MIRSPFTPRATEVWEKITNYYIYQGTYKRYYTNVLGDDIFTKYADIYKMVITYGVING